MVKTRTTFPKEVSIKSIETVIELEGQGFFSSEFSNPENAKSLFYDTFAEALLSKFITGDEIEFEPEEFERAMTLAAVEHAVSELEEEGRVHRFDDIVVLASRLEN